jgi:hypothetical protein
MLICGKDQVVRTLEKGLDVNHLLSVLSHLVTMGLLMGDKDGNLVALG